MNAMSFGIAKRSLIEKMRIISKRNDFPKVSFSEAVEFLTSRKTRNDRRKIKIRKDLQQDLLGKGRGNFRRIWRIHGIRINTNKISNKQRTIMIEYLIIGDFFSSSLVINFFIWIDTVILAHIPFISIYLSIYHKRNLKFIRISKSI